MKRIRIQRITLTAILSAISVILYFYVKFPLPFFPPFLEINFSMLPAYLGGYMMGPVFGSLIVGIRFLAKLGITHTAGVGEIADLIIGLCAVITASIFYRYHRSKKGALVSLLLGSLAWTISAILANYLVLVPTYVELYFAGNLDAFVSVLSVIPSVDASNYMEKYLLFAALPFNLLLSVIVSVLTFIIYKPMHRLIKSFTLETKKEVVKEENNHIYLPINTKEVTIKVTPKKEEQTFYIHIKK